MDPLSATLVTELKQYVNQLCEANQHEAAMLAVNHAISDIQSAPGVIPISDYAAALELRGEILRETGDLIAAANDYQEAIELLEAEVSEFPLLGRLHASLGAVYQSLGDIENAAQIWQTSVHCFEHSEPPLWFDAATMSNNLGFLYKSLGDADAAENCFLRALEILHTEYGDTDPQTAAVSCNLGTLYFAAGFYDQALKMHTAALATRRKLLGNRHPDTAQSHNNLALTLCQTGDTAAAREHFDASLQTFESLGAEYADDLESVAGNYCEFLRVEGLDAEADEISDRVELLLSQYHSP